MASLLLLTIILPALGAVVLGLAPRSLPVAASRGLALGISALTLALTVVLVLAFRYPAPPDSPEDLVATRSLGGQVQGAFFLKGDEESDGLTSVLDFERAFPPPQFTLLSADQGYGPAWIALGRSSTDASGDAADQVTQAVRFAVGLDGISLFLFGLTSLMGFVTILLAWQSPSEQGRGPLALLLLLQSSLLGLFASLDAVLFYVFFELSLFPLFFLIGRFGGPHRRKAAVVFVVYTLVGSLLSLLGLLGLILVNYSYGSGVLTTSIPELTRGLGMVELASWNQLDGGIQQAIFWLLFAGFAIKTPLFPLHNWLPLSYSEAPPATRVMLAGVVSKLGVYGFVRFALGMTPLGIQANAPLLMGLSIAGILYGALVALAQSDAKRLVAYSSVSHMGFIALGLFALNPTAMDGSVIQMVNHGLTTGALFAALGFLEIRTGSTSMETQGGIWFRLPVLSFFLIVAALGSAAVPGLNGFVGEFPILMGTFATSQTAGILAAMGMILGAYYLMVMLRRLVFGTDPLGGSTKATDSTPSDELTPVEGQATTAAGWPMVTALTPIALLIVAIGLSPRTFLQPIRAIAEGYATRVTASVIPGESGAIPRVPTPYRPESLIEDVSESGGLSSGG